MNSVGAPHPEHSTLQPPVRTHMCLCCCVLMHWWLYSMCFKSVCTWMSVKAPMVNPHRCFYLFCLIGPECGCVQLWLTALWLYCKWGYTSWGNQTWNHITNICRVNLILSEVKHTIKDFQGTTAFFLYLSLTSSGWSYLVFPYYIFSVLQFADGPYSFLHLLALEANASYPLHRVPGFGE